MVINRFTKPMRMAHKTRLGGYASIMTRASLSLVTCLISREQQEHNLTRNTTLP